MNPYRKKTATWFRYHHLFAEFLRSRLDVGEQNYTPYSFAFGAPVPLLALVGLFFNIVGVEFWWRGYILPRQEVRFGRRAWLVNGTRWSFFHIFKWWGLPGLLVVCQIVPFLSQKLKNNWPAMIMDFLINGLGIVVSVVMLLMK
jgi:hypothetical protein